MNESQKLGLITFGIFALVALVLLVMPGKWYRQGEVDLRSRYYTALLALVIGAGFGYYQYAKDNYRRITTLYETVIEGSAGVGSGASAPELTVSFTVEHPGVKHELVLNPTKEQFEAVEPPVAISFALSGPEKKILLAERTEQFRFRPRLGKQYPSWETQAFPFTPTVAGTHQVRLRTRTAGIPGISVRIVDPQKRDDGK